MSGGVIIAGSKLAITGGNRLVILDKLGGITDTVLGPGGEQLSPAVARGADILVAGSGLYRYSPIEGLLVEVGFPGGVLAPSPILISDGGDAVIMSSARKMARIGESGTVKWEQDLGGGAVDGGLLIFGAGSIISSNRGVFDLETGESIGSLSAGGADFSSLLIGDGFLLGGRTEIDAGARGSLARFDLCGEVQWIVGPDRYRSRLLVGFGNDSAVLFERDSLQNTSGFMVRRSLETGESLLEVPSEGASPVAIGADDTMYWGACPNGTDLSIRATDQNFVELWRIDLPGEGCPMDEAVIDSDGVLYATALGNSTVAIVAIQTESPGLAPSLLPVIRHDAGHTGWLGN